MTEQLRQCAIHCRIMKVIPQHAHPHLIQHFIREGFKMKVKIKESGWSLLRENYFFSPLQLDRIGFLSGCMNQISDEIRSAWRAMLQNDLYGGVRFRTITTTFYPYSARKFT